MPSAVDSSARSLVVGTTLLVIIFGVALIASTQLGGGWWWDIAGGIGFVALAFFGLLNLATGQGARLPSHKALGWWALALTAVHAAVYLATDSVVVNHLNLAAPPAMLVGIAVLVVALFGAIVSLSRWKLPLHGSRKNFRLSHRIMSWAVLLGCLYHVAATAHSVHHLWQLLLLGGGAFVLLLVASKVASRLAPTFSMLSLLLVSLVVISGFVVLRNV